MDDNLAKLWRTELNNAANSNDIDGLYENQLIEIDAFAFTQSFLSKYEGISVTHPNEQYQKIIEAYIEKNKNLL